MLTARLGLAGEEPATLRRTAEPLGLHVERVRQLQQLAVTELAVAAHGQRAGADGLRDVVGGTLRCVAGPPQTGP